mmetsp:Transcript_17865/g.24939  ORF Transcript_17865/g.24939 Transcript_17865/m.24939 type:complete len:351 (+) Transcript_17865:152-1204(+)|eukprot:CAMPEP_0184503520 /NCGR_PEP_ID=MMETSP0113_2-20130426/51937_1 /TAXON_ID=91329 /ORGANISM="Norrisiella sphaerica, Strain BC52" /LENGTH=350 /DNA_ID=CAMNT_0026893033 /DNA_START=697 /DNA_END=1749 /DNA_ORIENTATION=+
MNPLSFLQLGILASHFYSSEATWKNPGSKYETPTQFVDIGSAAETGKTPKKAMVYVEHVMKCGGTDLCSAFARKGGCSVDIMRNCKVNDFTAERIESITGGIQYNSADITPKMTAKIAKHKNLQKLICGDVFSEPGCTRQFDQDFGAMTQYQNLSSSFWDAYKTVLLVRDPWPRYVSHLYQENVIQGEMISMAAKVPKAVDFWLNDSNASPFGQERVALLRNNFITQHIVSDFRKKAAVSLVSSASFSSSPVCTDEVLEQALRAVDNFDVILNMSDLKEESLQIAEKYLGLSRSLFEHLENSKGSRVTGIAYPTPSKQKFEEFKLRNRCDYAVVAHANARIKAMALEIKD